MHTDDSDVTFNICLGRNFSGAALTICGDSRSPTHRQFFKNYEHVRGRALVHLGARRHGADDISAGERNNLIVWNSNSKYRSSTGYINTQPYLKEEGPPDPRCLSYTHDRDFAQFLDYPPGKEAYRGRGWCPPPFACYDSMSPVLRGDKQEL
uniref:Fe2OG dioxygenase domain-containing protein n=2 Tax=Chrysotila carterae TaxID=13221 RepID=A0A7S4C3W3_CHRCT